MDRKISGRQGESGSPTARAEMGWLAATAALVEKATWLPGAEGDSRPSPLYRVKTSKRAHNQWYDLRGHAQEQCEEGWKFVKGRGGNSREEGGGGRRYFLMGIATRRMNRSSSADGAA